MQYPQDIYQSVMGSHHSRMDVYETRRERLRTLIADRFEGVQARLATAIDRQADYVSRCLKGTKRIGEEFARHIEKSLGLPDLWLDGSVTTDLKVGYDIEGKPVENVEPVGPERFRRVPLIGWVQAGMLTEFSDPFPVGIADDYELVDIEYGRRTVALRIKNDSMEPDFREGDIIIVDPDLAPRPGDFVVAKNHVEEATFKKYRPRGTAPDGSLVFELAPLNDDYPTLRSDVDHLRIVGVMIEHRRRMRR